MNKFFSWLIHPPTEGPNSILLLRLMAGGVFFWEGILKFVYVNQGVGRFTKLGIPFPQYTATFIGCLEIVGGMLLLSGLLTRLIAIPFVIEMIVAILTTRSRCTLELRRCHCRQLLQRWDFGPYCTKAAATMRRF